MISESSWVIIPAYNEHRHIGSVISGVKRFSANIVVVDDGSSDKTSRISKAAGVIVLRHIVNLGKGCALKTGCDYAVLNGATKIIVIDADGQHKPEQIPQFLRALKSADIVFGYRTFNKKMPFVFRFGNSIISYMTKHIFGISLRDTQCGYRAFTVKAYRKVRWESRDYTMESEMVINTAKRRLRFKEIPIDTIYADKYKGTTFMDGVKISTNLLWWKLSK